MFPIGFPFPNQTDGPKTGKVPHKPNQPQPSGMPCQECQSLNSQSSRSGRIAIDSGIRDAPIPLRNTSTSILSRDPNLSRKPSEPPPQKTAGYPQNPPKKTSCRFLKNGGRKEWTRTQPPDFHSFRFRVRSGLGVENLGFRTSPRVVGVSREPYLGPPFSIGWTLRVTWETITLPESNIGDWTFEAFWWPNP